MEIINAEQDDPITLRADVIDMGLLHLLESKYVVIIEQRENNIVIELYKKQQFENMRKIEHIFVHCTASNQSWGVKELWAEFKAKGWKNPGYHYVITADGGTNQMLAVEEVSNGVQGYNSTAINIAYVGGISKVNGKMVATDNRTPEQKASLRKLLTLLRQKFPNAKIMGHRSIWGEDTPSKWKKSCPCFNAVAEYADI